MDRLGRAAADGISKIEMNKIRFWGGAQAAEPDDALIQSHAASSQYVVKTVCDASVNFVGCPKSDFLFLQEEKSKIELMEPLLGAKRVVSSFTQNLILIAVHVVF